MSQRLSLEQIKIAEPCHASWDAMTGDGQKRFCNSCSKHVHDLSQMSREEAEALLGRGESVCVRMQHTQSGRVVTRSEVDRSPRWFRYAASVAAMLGITSLFQSGCKPADKTIQGAPLPPETPNVRTMGIVAMPERLMGAVPPATQPTEERVVLGESPMPTTQPTPPPVVEPMKMGKVAPTTLPTSLPSNVTFWKTSPYDTGGFLLPSDD